MHKMLDDNFVEQRTGPVPNLMIYVDTTFSNCHIPNTNNILHTVSSYRFQSYKKLFQAGNFNVNIRPDLMYFRILKVYSKRYQKGNL